MCMCTSLPCPISRAGQIFVQVIYEAGSFLKVHLQEQSQLAVKRAVVFFIKCVCKLSMLRFRCVMTAEESESAGIRIGVEKSRSDFRTPKVRIGMRKSSGVILLMQRLCARQNRSTPTGEKEDKRISEISAIYNRF